MLEEDTYWVFLMDDSLSAKLLVQMRAEVENVLVLDTAVAATHHPHTPRRTAV